MPDWGSTISLTDFAASSSDSPDPFLPPASLKYVVSKGLSRLTEAHSAGLSPLAPIGGGKRYVPFRPRKTRTHLLQKAAMRAYRSRRHYRSFRDSAFRLETIPEDHELTAAISTPSTSTTPSTDIRVIIPPFSCISHKGPPTPPARTNDPSVDDSKGTKGGWGGGGDLVSETGVEWAKVTLRVVIVCCLLVGLLMVLLPNAWRLVPSLTPSAADRSFMRVSLAFLEQHAGVEGVGEVAGLKALRGPGS